MSIYCARCGQYYNDCHVCNGTFDIPDHSVGNMSECIHKDVCQYNKGEYVILDSYCKNCTYFSYGNLPDPADYWKRLAMAADEYIKADINGTDVKTRVNLWNKYVEILQESDSHEV